VNLIKSSDIEYFDYNIPYICINNSYRYLFSRSKIVYPCQTNWENEIIYIFGKTEIKFGNKVKTWTPSKPKNEYLCCHKEDLNNVINMPKDSLNVDYINNHLSENDIANVFASVVDVNKFLLMQ
jgi:hypothetical protein